MALPIPAKPVAVSITVSLRRSHNSCPPTPARRRDSNYDGPIAQVYPSDTATSGNLRSSPTKWMAIGAAGEQEALLGDFRFSSVSRLELDGSDQWTIREGASAFTGSCAFPRASTRVLQPGSPTSPDFRHSYSCWLGACLRLQIHGRTVASDGLLVAHRPRRQIVPKTTDWSRIK